MYYTESLSFERFFCWVVVKNPVKRSMSNDE